MQGELNVNNKNILVLDTEYDTNPKRLLALSYLIYKNNSIVKEVTKYVKYASDVFSVDETGESYQYHKLTNKFLQENGESINSVISQFKEDLDNIDMIIGQNILSADIHAIRKESIGTFNWYDDIRDTIKKIPIYDTMYAFREKNPEEKSSLDSIYKFLFEEEMLNHHNATDDCKNTFKCFNEMVKLDYNFKRQVLKFSEEYQEEVTKESKKCDMCESKILEDTSSYKFINKFNVTSVEENVSYLEDGITKYVKEPRTYSIINNILKENQEICKRCFGNLEILIQNKDNQLINIVKLKSYDSLIKYFFELVGDEETIVYLKSQYKDKDNIKKLGGKWDSKKKVWYFTYNKSTTGKIKKFSRWIVKEDSKENSMEI